MEEKNWLELMVKQTQTAQILGNKPLYGSIRPCIEQGGRTSFSAGTGGRAETGAQGGVWAEYTACGYLCIL